LVEIPEEVLKELLSALKKANETIEDLKEELKKKESGQSSRPVFHTLLSELKEIKEQQRRSFREKLKPYLEMCADKVIEHYQKYGR